MKFVDLDAQHQRIETDIARAIEQVLDHKQFIMGPEIGVLEGELRDYCGCRHVLSAASGTDALMMALMALGVGRGDAVIAPPFTFVATAEVIELLGATTVFVDVDEATFNIDTDKLEQTILEVKERGEVNLKGIIPVDLFGLPAALDEIQEIARRHDLFMLCDAAQSFGATYKGRKTGGFGDISATSFFPAKPLGCYGDGGAVFTNSDHLAALVESIRFHGKGVSQYENIRIGVTGRMDTIQAAILSCKLKIFDEELGRRQEIADYYSKNLNDFVNTPSIPPGLTSSWAVYTIRTPHREKIKARLQSEKIPFAVYYPAPLHQQPAFQNAIGGGETMEVSDRLAGEVISLPVHPYLSSQELDKVISEIKLALN